jgi:hypothetical protein
VHPASREREFLEFGNRWRVAEPGGAKAERLGDHRMVLAVT